MTAETELLTRCRRGEAEAWDELFALHYDPACRFVFQLASDLTREDVEEICQEAFLSVIRNLGSFLGESAFQTWLFRIAANKARDHREKQQAAKRGGGQRPLSLQAEDPQTGLTLDPPSSAPAPDAVLARSEDAALVHRALEEVGEPCRELVELRYFGDLSYDEIAAALKLNPKTVSSRLSRCLDRLEEITKALFAGGKPVNLPSNP
jgi:RNA polymerase sigma-70 factor (ECF subfamily)